MSTRVVPGVYQQNVYPSLQPVLRTGVPAFLGRLSNRATGGATAGPVVATAITRWPQFWATFAGAPGGYLAHAVRGFFENGGELCYVVGLDESLPPAEAIRLALLDLGQVDDVDLICVPDLFALPDLTRAQITAVQQSLLEHCATRGDRFAVLDAGPDSDPQVVLAQRAEMAGPAAGYGALYFPWLRVTAMDGSPLPVPVPPCGHLSGRYARTDLEVGTHKAPANEVIDDVLDVQVDLDPAQLTRLSEGGVNSIRAIRGRGIRVWGARTLSDDQNWQDLTVRRSAIAIGRWVERFMLTTVHEPNDVRLWVRIMRELTGYLDGLFGRGALKGNSVDEAFYVKCDNETNPPETIDAGIVSTQIGVALVRPAEFIVVRVIQSANGVNVDVA